MDALMNKMCIRDSYNSWQFEVQALERIRELFQEKEVVLMTGGSMLYIDAVCKGIDDIPTISPELRTGLMEVYEREGLESIRQMLKELDPVFYGQVDLNNGKRVLHAVEVCRMAGVPYSSLRKNTPKDRGFRIVPVSYTHLDVYKRQSDYRSGMINHLVEGDR